MACNALGGLANIGGTINEEPKGISRSLIDGKPVTTDPSRLNAGLGDAEGGTCTELPLVLSGIGVASVDTGSGAGGMITWLTAWGQLMKMFRTG